MSCGERVFARERLDGLSHNRLFEGPATEVLGVDVAFGTTVVVVVEAGERAAGCEVATTSAAATPIRVALEPVVTVRAPRPITLRATEGNVVTITADGDVGDLALTSTSTAATSAASLSRDVAVATIGAVIRAIDDLTPLREPVHVALRGAWSSAALEFDGIGAVVDDTTVVLGDRGDIRESLFVDEIGAPQLLVARGGHPIEALAVDGAHVFAGTLTTLRSTPGILRHVETAFADGGDAIVVGLVVDDVALVHILGRSDDRRHGAPVAVPCVASATCHAARSAPRATVPHAC